MTPKGKKTLIIISSLLVIGGVVGYFLWKRKKDKDKEGKDKEGQPDLPPSPSIDTGVKDVRTGGASSVSNPVGDSEGIKKFQDWMDLKHPNWLSSGKSLNKGGGYGNFGSNTKRAWDSYGSEYSKTLAPATQQITGSGFKKGDKLYPKIIFDNAYTYPSKETRYVAGKVLRDGGNVVASMLEDSNTKGWIKAKTIVTGYVFNPATNKYKSELKDVFLESKNYTNIAP